MVFLPITGLHMALHVVSGCEYCNTRDLYIYIYISAVDKLPKTKVPPKSNADQVKSKRSQCVRYKTASIPKTSWNPVPGAAALILAAGG